MLGIEAGGLGAAIGGLVMTGAAMLGAAVLAPVFKLIYPDWTWRKAFESGGLTVLMLYAGGGTLAVFGYLGWWLIFG